MFGELDLVMGGIVSTNNVRRFIEIFAKNDNWHNLEKEQANLGYGWVHYSMIRILQPKRVLCIGSKFGFVPGVCAIACRDNGLGAVDFVDAGLDEKDQTQTDQWGGVGFWKSDKGKQFEHFGLSEYIQLHVMTSKKFSEKFGRKMWGYMHIDGDHSYKGVKSDFISFWPKLEEKGFLGIHDIFTDDTMGDKQYGTRKFWQELKKEYSHTLEFSGKCGLGIVQKL